MIDAEANLAEISSNNCETHLGVIPERSSDAGDMDKLLNVIEGPIMENVFPLPV